MKTLIFILILAPINVFSKGTASFMQSLPEAGLVYSGPYHYKIEKNIIRGNWSGKAAVFRTISASSGANRLRLELTKNISAAQAEKTMKERFLRIDALYSGGAAYPGMITTEVSVPESLRPVEVKAGPVANSARLLAATQNLAYGAGAEELVVYRGVLGWFYCTSSAMLTQYEIFFPKAVFSPEKAGKEAAAFSCKNPGIQK